MTAIPQTERTWRFPAKLALDQSAFMAMLWAGFVVVVAAVTAGVAYWEEVDSSIWEQSATQIPRWFLVFIGVYLAQTIMPTYIAHGRTRREFAIEMALFTAAYVTAGALLMVLGFAIEGIAYNIAGWPHEFTGDHLFTSPWHVPAIFFEFVMMFAVWTIGGLFIGAAFVAGDEKGYVAIALAFIPAGLLDAAVGSSWGPVELVFGAWLDLGKPPAVFSIVLCLVSVALVAGMAWWEIRDVSLRNKTQ